MLRPYDRIVLSGLGNSHKITMFLHVTKVTYLHDYRLRLEFSDDTAREVDLTRELHGEAFEPLKDLDLLRQIYSNPNTNTIERRNGVDCASEFLHEIDKEVKKIA